MNTRELCQELLTASVNQSLFPTLLQGRVVGPASAPLPTNRRPPRPD